MALPETFRLRIDPEDGAVEFIHNDELDRLLRPALGGRVNIRRASHVEPTEDGQWTADMAPSDGPVLGPFPSRSEALAEETDWLKRERTL